MLNPAALLVALALAAGAGPGPLPGYAVRAEVPLHAASEGVEGRLQLLVDERVTPAIDSAAWNAGVEWDTLLAAPDSTRTTPVRRPLRPMLRIVDGRGAIVHTEVLHNRAVLARFDVRNLYGDARQSVLVTVDLSTSMGTSSGPWTRVAEVRRGRLLWVQASHGAARRRVPLAMTEAIRAQWRVVQPQDRPTEILWWESHMVPGDGPGRCRGEFTTTYSRARTNGRTWTIDERSECADREAGDTFPPRELFPR